jgi:quinol monooxygenase YgiN
MSTTKRSAETSSAGARSDSFRSTGKGSLKRWRSTADVERHIASSHVQSLLGTIAPMLAEPPVIETVVEA